MDKNSVLKSINLQAQFYDEIGPKH